jgi:hypothetical protein
LFSIAAWTRYGADASAQSPNSKTPQQNAPAAEKSRGTEQDPAQAALPRGKKLMLKDGHFELVREYERKGERVRFYSLERRAWEEIPAAMVDWNATAKAEAESEKDSAALLRKIHTQEEAAKVEMVMDIDASLQVAPGVFLPPGEGMFLIQGKSVTPMGQVGSQVKTDRKTFLKQVLSPIPIVPSKRNVEIPGAKAETRVTNGVVPEFYLREAPPDPERASPVQKSSRPGESGPEVELVRATVKGNKRHLESIKSLFGQESTERKSIPMQRWEVAATVFRFTLGEQLPPGEYALAEILPDGMNLYVWDFGVDGSMSSKKPAKH